MIFLDIDVIYLINVLLLTEVSQPSICVSYLFVNVLIIFSNNQTRKHQVNFNCFTEIYDQYKSKNLSEDSTDLYEGNLKDIPTNYHLENYCKQQNMGFIDNGNINKLDLNSKGLHLHERDSSKLAKKSVRFYILNL